MANESLVQTYSQIITSNAVLMPVIQQLNLTYKPSDLAKMISLTSNNQSEVITLNVKAKSAQLAAKIANLVASVFQKKVVSIMQVQNVQIIDHANPALNPLPVSPNKKLNIAIAAVLGLLVSVGIAFLMEYLDDRVRSEEEATQLLGVPVLGVVPFMPSTAQKSASLGVNAPLTGSAAVKPGSQSTR